MAGGQDTSGGVFEMGDRWGDGLVLKASRPLARFEPIFPPRRRRGYNRGHERTAEKTNDLGLASHCSVNLFVDLVFLERDQQA
jgi:hypothetical protein